MALQADLLESIPQTRYLSADSYVSYRAIMRTFYLEYQKMRYQLVEGFQAVLGQQVTVGQLAAAELHPGQGVSMGQQAEAVQVLEGDGLPGRQGVAQRHGDAEAVLQIRPYPRCRTSTP